MHNEEHHCLYFAEILINDQIDEHELWNVWRKSEMPAGICWGIPKERNYIEDTRIENR